MKMMADSCKLEKKGNREALRDAEDVIRSSENLQLETCIIIHFWTRNTEGRNATMPNESTDYSTLLLIEPSG